MTVKKMPVARFTCAGFELGDCDNEDIESIDDEDFDANPTGYKAKNLRLVSFNKLVPFIGYESDKENEPNDEEDEETEGWMCPDCIDQYRDDGITKIGHTLAEEIIKNGFNPK